MWRDACEPNTEPWRVTLVKVFYRELFSKLEELGVRYAVVGGIAVNLHGVPRMTYDVDIVCARDFENLAALDRALADLNLKVRQPFVLTSFVDPEVARDVRERRNMLALTFTDPNDPLREVDVLVATPFDAEAICDRAENRSWDGLEVHVASKEDLLAMKTGTGRAQDEADCAHLRRLTKR
jgi:hypothetical protein